jgi:hypothetical protein
MAPLTLFLRRTPLVSIAILLLSTSSFANPIQDENAHPGTSAWRITNLATNHEIEGYASLTSVNRGNPIDFFVNTTEPQYTLEIYRMGWYGPTTGGRLMMPPVTLPGTAQPMPSPDPATALLECHWTVSYSLTVPTTWCSGFYLVKLTAIASGNQNYIGFVVRNDSYPSPYLFQCSVTTYQAYNQWGGEWLYGSHTLGDWARKVSFNRPYYSDSNGVFADGDGEFLKYEYRMVRFLEREGYDVSYCTNIDTHQRSDLLTSHSAFLSVGHDEYWSRAMRNNVEAARDLYRVNLGFFGANAAFWQIRFEPDAAGNPDRTIVCYKWHASTEDPIALDGDPSNDQLLTVRWRENPVNRPEDDLIGIMYAFDPVYTDMVISDASHWALGATGLQNGDHIAGLVGYEADRVVNNQRNVVVLARSPVPASSCRMPDLIPCVPEANMTLYQAANDAIVFATGTIFWDKGLDDLLYGSLLDPRVQQITRNILGRFASAPCAELSAGMVAWWPGENTARDAFGHDGTLQGGAGFAPGNVGQAFSLVGSGYVEVPDVPAFRFASAFTLEGWILPNSVSVNQPVLSKWSNAPGNWSYEMSIAPNGALRCDVSGDGSNFAGGTVLSADNVLNVGQWSHVAATFDAGLQKLFVNGVQVATHVSPITSAYPGIADLLIGGTDGGAQYFAGLIDEPAVYSRALSEPEIQAIFGSGTRGRCVTPLSVPDHSSSRLESRAPWPNPTERTVTAEFALPNRASVRAEVLDVSGRRVASLLDHLMMDPGLHPVRWNCVDEAGKRVAPGVYLLRVEAGSLLSVRRIVVIR